MCLLELANKHRGPMLESDILNTIRQITYLINPMYQALFQVLYTFPWTVTFLVVRGRKVRKLDNLPKCPTAGKLQSWDSHPLNLVPEFMPLK